MAPSSDAPPPPPGIPWQQAGGRGHGCLYSVIAGLVVLLVVIVIISVIASHTSTTLGSGTRAHPARADVSITHCTVDPSGAGSASGVIYNHSSGTSNYTFQVNFLEGNAVVGQGWRRDQRGVQADRRLERAGREQAHRSRHLPAGRRRAVRSVVRRRR